MIKIYVCRHRGYGNLRKICIVDEHDNKQHIIEYDIHQPHRITIFDPNIDLVFTCDGKYHIYKHNISAETRKSRLENTDINWECKLLYEENDLRS